MSFKVKSLRFAATILLGVVCVSTASSQTPDRQPPVGRIVGNLDGISQDGDRFFISGWACQQGQEKSIAVHVYGDDLKDPSKRALLIVQFANLYSEPAVQQTCQDRAAGKHRFVIVLPHGYGPQSKIYVHGIRLVEGVPNEAVAGSGLKLKPVPLEMPHPPLPAVSGTYRSSTEHPRVFMTAADLKELAARINRSGSYSQQRFGQLAGQIKRDLGSGIDWDVTYSECGPSLDEGPGQASHSPPLSKDWVYTYTFSYEPQDHHEAEIRTALHLAPDAKYPTGAAVVAARLALYAALVKTGAAMPPGAPTAADAAALAKRILLAWADRGFPRDARGRILPLVSSVCGPLARPPTMTQPRGAGGLELGRGVLYSVQAQDLLQSFGAVSAGEAARLDALHAGMFELLRQAANAGTGTAVFPYPDCARYNNISAHILASLLATARLLDDRSKVNAVLYGGTDPAAPLLLSWVTSIDRLIYGEADRLPYCGENRFPDSLTSLQNHTDFQTKNVAPGEIADRGRNASPGQGIGYPMITLGRLFDSAEILRVAGFDPYGYRGAHQQSIEMALQYYACFAKGAGFYQVVTAENSGSCPNAAQYYGKLVSGVDLNLLIGAYRFPLNKAITGVEAAAKVTASGAVTTFSTDAILFGKWRD